MAVGTDRAADKKSGQCLALTGLQVSDVIWKPHVSAETGKINVYHVVAKQARSMALESEFLVAVTSSATTNGVT